MALSKQDKNRCASFLNDLSKAFYYDDEKLHKKADCMISLEELMLQISELNTYVANICKN